jgi:hypothetical protein
MSDLNDLAAAATYQAPRTAARRHQRRAKNKAVVWSIAGGAALLAIVVGYVLLKSSGTIRSGGDPGLRVDVVTDSLQRWITITSKNEGRTRIDRVSVNGEWDAPRCELDLGRIARVTDTRFPATLTIGDATHACVVGMTPAAPSYTKGVVFIDVYTSSGRHRWREGKWE